MLWDLGLDDFDDVEAVRNKIEELEEQFNLVMILERFEESLVLMKSELCWDFSDITNLKLNARKPLNSKITNTTR